MFKSTRQVDQMVLSHRTLTESVDYTYELCDNPSTLNNYCYDAKQGLKFYTNPYYIYHIWIENQSQQLEEKRKRVS